MPYIPQERRDHFITFTGTEFADTAGELNYLLTQVALVYLDRKGLSYATINDVMGALEGAKAEFYRRVAAPYEDTKIKENGDVYGQSN